MNNRLELHEFLKQILGSDNAYYDPPSSVRMKYPAIRYILDNGINHRANNLKYMNSYRYTCTLIDQDADSGIAKKMFKNSEFVFDRHYIADNLHHFVFHVWTNSV